MTARITSKQIQQISRLAEVAAGNAVLDALEQVSLDLDTAQVEIIARGGEFQALILPEATALIVRAFNRLIGKKHPAADLLEKYFREVYGYTLDLTGVVFPEKEGFGAYMAVPPKLNEDAIASHLAGHFKVDMYSWKTPIATNLNRELEQKRPQGLYVFAHRGGDEPDDIHRNKSYDDAMGQNLIFLNPKEYLLASGFHRYTKKYFMDRNGWTRTSSLWSDCHLVDGCWDDARTELCLHDGYRDYRAPGSGLREAVFA